MVTAAGERADYNLWRSRFGACCVGRGRIGTGTGHDLMMLAALFAGFLRRPKRFAPI
jgi:hypothetical protein